MRQEALLNPDVLVWARESINMDIEEAAAKIGVRPDRLRTWETGAKRPTIGQARKLSRVYRRPLAAFYLPERPGRLGFSVPHDFRRLPEDQPRQLSPELITELRRIEFLREAAVDLAEEIPKDPEQFIGRTRVGEPVEDVAERAIRLLRLPAAARREWRSEYDALNGWKNDIEHLGVLVMHLNRVSVGEVRGIAIAEPVFPLIAVNGKDAVSSRIFTLLHEFVHLMVGATGMSNLRIAARPRSDDQRTEQFCNYVAGEILVPRADLLGHDAVRAIAATPDWPDEVIARLAAEFKVSREVIVRRLLIVGRTTVAFYRSKRRQYAQERQARGKPSGGPMKMSRRILRSVGQPFARLALSAYHREDISSSELAELLGARLKHVPAVEEILSGPNRLTGGDE